MHSTRFARLACLIHAASVHPELGSNSHKWSKFSSLDEENLATNLSLAEAFPPEADPPLAEAKAGNNNVTRLRSPKATYGEVLNFGH